MANLPDGPPVKVNDVEVTGDGPITESLLNKIGVDLNYLIQNAPNYQSVKLQRQIFTANGTFPVPSNTSLVLLIGCGGGGGGGGGPGINSSNGANGGDGAPMIHTSFNVTPSASVSVTIGVGGPGGSAGSSGIGTNGSDGSTTLFGSRAFIGGRGGGAGQTPPFGGYGAIGNLSAAQIAELIRFNFLATRTINNQGYTGGALGGSGGITVNAAVSDGYKGQSTGEAIGGNGGTKAVGKSAGGGGGASFGSGGVGGDGGVNNATAGSTGGGGGGGCASSPNGGTGANGGNGYLIVIWVAE